MIQNPWIPATPTPKQARFLVDPRLEVLYGGSAGGGKSAALLMAALQYVDVPGYAALMLRRTFRDLALPGALLDMAADWLAPTKARWHAQAMTWRFPSGATLTFGNLDNEADKYKYHGSVLQFIGFDELTQFSETAYRYLFSRLRRATGVAVPLRMRATSNPGGIGHAWVRSRFIDARRAERSFIAAGLADNPYIDADAYLESLAQLDPVTRAQLLNGDWSARADGGYFRREWMEIVDIAPAQAARVRYWDFAATEVKEGRDPDWTAGARVALLDGVYYLEDMRHVRTTPAGVQALVRQTAEQDGPGVPVHIEQEPGSSGKTVIDHYQRTVLVGWALTGDPATGSKLERAKPVSAAAEAGNLKLVRGSWIAEYLDEAEAFPGGSHDDQVDAVSGAVAALAHGWHGLMDHYARLRAQREAVRDQGAAGQRTREAGG